MGPKGRAKYWKTSKGIKSIKKFTYRK